MIQVKFDSVCLSACIIMIVHRLSYPYHALGFKCWQIQHPYLLEEWLYCRPLEAEVYSWDYVGYHRY